jgi:uncharacterized protein YecE (DUF72 family)
MRKGKIRVGTSGWLYKHWKGTFYPPGLKSKDEFAFYSLFFDTLEVNNTFYKLPSRETFAEWRRTTKPDFLYIIKAGGFITHRLKLNNPELALERFFDACTALEEKLGVILFQLPPGWKINIERFEHFLAVLPDGYRYAFEFREESWYDAAITKLLKQYNCAFCIYQLAGHTSPIEVTADFLYLRLHGPTQYKYQGNYDYYTLRAWAELSRQWQAKGKDVYIYFDNDDSGYAAFNAQVMEMMLNKDEPITKQEADVLAVLIAAIKQRSAVKFCYERTWKVIAPYLVALTRKGKGDLFFTGYDEAATKAKPVEYLLKKINIKHMTMVEEDVDFLKVEAPYVYEPPANVRVVYRTILKGRGGKKS